MALKRAFRLVLVRHGESTWNLENRFTGWTDVPLSPTGIQEARLGAQMLKQNNMHFDQVYVSVLRRAIQTMNIVLDETDQHHLPVEKSWRLNERHYGALQGLNKAETAAKHGEDKVKLWRRSYDIPPPPLEVSDPRHPSHENKYRLLPQEVIPKTECLLDCVNRVLPFWEDKIAPSILSGRQVIIFAHGNSLRGLVKHLDSISDKDIVGLNIPTGIPLVYELNDVLKPVRHYYLLNEEELKKRVAAVEQQGKVKK